MPDSRLIRQADQIFSKCGRPILPGGKTCVDIFKAFQYQTYLVTTGTVPPYPAVSNAPKEISGDTVFMLKAISGINFNSMIGDAPPLAYGALYLQVMMPNGRMIQNQLTDAGPDLGFGSGRLVLDNPIPCPPGCQIFLALDLSTSGFSGTLGNFSVAMLLEGGLRYFLESDASTPAPRRSAADSAARLPRYYPDTPNQNIIAPEWMTSGLNGEICDSETPAGMRDEAFTYSNTLAPAVFSESDPVATNIQITIQSTTDFLARRMFFFVQAGDVAPTFFYRLRTSLGGSSITNDYIEANSQRFHKDWFIRRGITIYVDIFGLPNGGDSTTSLIVYFEGVKRGRAA